jgi:hypothetical protein
MIILDYDYIDIWIDFDAEVSISLCFWKAAG